MNLVKINTIKMIREVNPVEKSRKKNLLVFPVGTIGRDMMYCLVTNFLLTYILFAKGLTNAQLAAVTAIMVGARIFDALNDPIMGNIIERTRTKWGKFKPWLLIGILSTSLVIYMVFNTNLTGWKFIWLFGIFYFLYSITYTMHDISYWGMIPALGSDANERNQLTSRATLCSGIGSTLASVLIPMLTTGAMTLGGNAKDAYGYVALAVAIAGPMFLFITIFGVKEQRDYLTETPPPISLKKIVKTIVSNDQLVWISVIFLAQQIGNGIIIGGLGSTYIYIEFGYNGSLYSIFTTVGMAATAFLMIFYPMISRHICRKKLMKIMLAISVIGYVLMFVTGIWMSATMTKFWLLVIGYMLSNFGMYCYYLIMMISILNTVEYNELKNGTRDEAIVASLRPFITKMASAVTAIIVSVSYMIFGITDFTNRVSALENQAAEGLITETQKLTMINDVFSGITGSQTNGLMLCMTVLPCLLMVISFVLYMKKYILDEGEYDRICKELELRKKGN